MHEHRILNKTSLKVDISVSTQPSSSAAKPAEYQKFAVDSAYVKQGSKRTAQPQGSPPWRKQRTPQRQGSASKPAEQDSAQHAQRSATMPAAPDGEVLAAQRYEELQESLQQVFWDSNEVWQSSIRYEKMVPENLGELLWDICRFS